MLLAALSFIFGGHHADSGVVTQAPKRSPSNVDDVLLEPDVRPGGRGSSALGTASRSLDSGSWIGVRENPRDQERRLESKVP